MSIRAFFSALAWLCWLLHAGMVSAAAEDVSVRQRLDWVPLAQLTPQQRQALPVGSCGAYIAPLSEAADHGLAPELAPIRASAEQSLLTTDATATDATGNRQLVFIGDVIITQGYRQLAAQRAHYDEQSGVISAEQALQIREPGLLLLGDTAEINRQQDSLTLDNATYVFHNNHTRGQARQVHRGSDGLMVLDGASMTQCEPGNNSWQLKGSQITLDINARQGYAKNVRLLVKGVPIFYFPYLRFPLGDERLSGFLMPSIIYGEEGLNFSLPYYFNLAPNYDLLLTSHYLQAHGLLLDSHFRHLSRHFSTAMTIAHLNNDKGEIDGDDQALIDAGTLTEADVVPFKGQDRWSYTIDQRGGDGQPWFTRIDYTKVSDSDFFRDVDMTGIGQASDNYADQKVSAGYDFDHWALAIGASQYQPLGAGNPYRQRPSLRANGDYHWGDWTTTLDHQWVRFDHRDASEANPIITGDRLNLNYQLAYNYQPAWGFVRPTLQLKQLNYQLQDRAFRDEAERSPSLTVPQLRLDTGVVFERYSKRYLQTLEPRLLYLRSPYKDHGHLFDLTTDNRDIDFDTAELGFSYGQLFRHSRFTGADRIDDANQLSLGLTSRFISNQSGLEWLSIGLGQIVYFDDRQVTLNNVPQTQTRSDIVAQLRANPTEQMQLSSDLTLDKHSYHIRSGNLGFSYKTPAQHLLALNYRYVRDTVHQINSSLLAPLLSSRWHLLFHGRYDYLQKREVELLSAIEYTGCCHKVRFGYRHWLDTDLANTVAASALEYDYGSFLEVQFRGLGSTGRQLDTLLDDRIETYKQWQATHY
ncbi:MAG: LPS assembly protein LptD [Cellvibrionaceae bacterium]|nr:LPS assembly protein LptD [Cellvibrionaceae bacterium]